MIKNMKTKKAESIISHLANKLEQIFSSPFNSVRCSSVFLTTKGILNVNNFVYMLIHYSFAVVEENDF